MFNSTQSIQGNSPYNQYFVRFDAGLSSDEHYKVPDELYRQLDLMGVSVFPNIIKHAPVVVVRVPSNNDLDIEGLDSVVGVFDSFEEAMR